MLKFSTQSQTKKRSNLLKIFYVYLLLNSINADPLAAQTIHSSQLPPAPVPQEITPPTQLFSPAPVPKTKPLPPPEQLLQPQSRGAIPVPVPLSVPDEFRVEKFEVIGSSVFSQKELDRLLAPFMGRSLSLSDLFQVREIITKLYVDRGYITSGALILPQTIKNGIVRIQIIEGRLEAIEVTGTRRLNPDYIRSRLPKQAPLNQKRLLEALQLLRLNPLIKNIQAELEAGSNQGNTVLNVQVQEAKTLSAQLVADNGRSPSVGSFRRRIQLNEANLLGLGDGLSVAYSNTDGSNGIDASYTLPINSRNGTLSFNYGFNDSNVIEKPFNALDIIGNYRDYELRLQQPVVETPNRELLLGLTAARLESDISSDVLKNLGYPVSLLSPGADNEGNTRISTIAFFQQWTNRSIDEVFAARSQFNLGVGAFDATVNHNAPDSRFFSWLGQVQWVRQMAPDTLLLLRTNFQLADRALVPIEQFGLGGIDSVRGYRQDVLLGDNAVFASTEIRLPIYRDSEQNLLLQLTPFLDFGTSWDSGSRNFNHRPLAKSDTLASVGLGLRLQLSDRLTARFDWGRPLIDIDSKGKTWQENGLYFSINYNPF